MFQGKFFQVRNGFFLNSCKDRRSNIQLWTEILKKKTHVYFDLNKFYLIRSTHFFLRTKSSFLWALHWFTSTKQQSYTVFRINCTGMVCIWVSQLNVWEKSSVTILTIKKLGTRTSFYQNISSKKDSILIFGNVEYWQICFIHLRGLLKKLWNFIKILLL